MMAAASPRRPEMKHPLRSRFVALSLLPLLFAAAAAAAKPRQYTIEQFLATTNYGGASFSPDGRKILVSGNQTGVFNAFAVHVDGGPAVQLTDSKVSAVQ